MSVVVCVDVGTGVCVDVGVNVSIDVDISATCADFLVGIDGGVDVIDVYCLPWFSDWCWC